MLGNRSWDDWVARYGESHQHPLNQLTHTFGIPMILLALPILLAGIFWRPLLWCGVALFVVGWGLQFLGHAVEGKPPEFLSDWRFLLVGSRWWAATMRLRFKSEFRPVHASDALMNRDENTALAPEGHASVRDQEVVD
jgi:uncharacterized membrane protein YGL010W